jgi:hypothetical protein
MHTTSVDNAAFALEEKSYFIRRVGSDGFKISHQPTMKKVVSDRRASLDEQSEIKPAMRLLVKEQFDRGASMPVVYFPQDGTSVPDTPKLTLVVVEPESEWTGGGELRQQIAQWTKHRGESPRLYPASLVWCLKRPGRDFREKVEVWLAWKRVAKEVAEGTLGEDFDRSDRAELQSKVSEAEEAAKEEVWGGYRYVVIADSQEPDGLKIIDLGAGHSSGSETLCGRVITALKSQALLNESVGAGYIERNWPPALKASGAWPLASLRQSFLNGSLTRLLDPDTTLRRKIVEFVEKGDFGLASGPNADGTYERIWFHEPVTTDEVAFESGVFLLTKATAQALKAGVPTPPLGPEPQPSPTVDFPTIAEPCFGNLPLGPEPQPSPTVPAGGPGPEPKPGAQRPEPQPGLPMPGLGLGPEHKSGPEPTPGVQTKTIRLVGVVPPEVWNRLGRTVLAKLRLGSDLRVSVEFTVTVSGDVAGSLTSDLRQILVDLELADKVRIDSG